MKDIKKELWNMLAGKLGAAGIFAGYMLLAMLCVLFGVSVYIMTEYTEYVLGILLLGILVLFCKISCKLDTPVPTPVCCPLYESIRHCLYTAIMATESNSGLLTPITERNLDTIQRPLSGDNVHRFEYRVRVNPRSPQKPDASFIKYLINEELNQVFAQNTYIFSGLCTQISGLYVQSVRRCSGGFVLVIVPVCQKTAAFVSMHNQKELINDIAAAQPERPADDTF